VSTFAGVVGQDRAVQTLRAAAARPVHAYLLVGPAGTGKRTAAVAFAAELLCPRRPADGTCESCRRVLAGVHPDVVSVEREGAFIGIDTAREVTRLAAMSPMEGDRKVVILHDFHLVRDTGPALLKTIEEPPATTIFVILAEFLPPELVTIASRCFRVDFDPLTPAVIEQALQAEGIAPETAKHLAEASGGRLDRARLLASDPRFDARRQAWRDVPRRLDGTGAAAAKVADELLAFLESSVEPLKVRHAAEMEELLERNRRAAQVVGTGGKGAKSRAVNAGVKDLEERQRRAERRQRTDELRFGLATLAAAYRDRLRSAADPRRRAEAIEAVARIDKVAKDLEYNPGELLALQALLVRLGRIALQG
jgi:DNA polymerase III subunit delta'